jgi:hypothetical protein
MVIDLDGKQELDFLSPDDSIKSSLKAAEEN